MSPPVTKAATPATKAGGPKKAGRPTGAGGQRLAAAFDTVTRLPALAESRLRLLRLTDKQDPSPSDLAEAVESDAALAIAVMRAANNGNGATARVGGIEEAIGTLSSTGLRAIAGSLETYDAFESIGSLSAAYERFRRHGLATRHAADRVAEATRLGQREELAVAALLHDVGRLVLVQLYGEAAAGQQPESPEERVRRERRELGIDHALVGAVLVRRWGLKPGIAAAIERHHTADAEGHAAAVGLADAIVHHAAGDAVSAESLLRTATSLGLGEDALRSLLYEFPHTGTQRRRSSDPCPLSNREIDALRGLAEGKVYKQIAAELNLSVSTIRTHLHNVYGKLGVVDRAQAVLIARDRGWI